MGSPELPSDAGEEDLRTTHIVHHPPAPSDDSDNESVNDYDGYQPLAMDEHHQGYVQNGFDDDDDEEEDATTNDDNNHDFNTIRPQQPTLAEDNAEVDEVTYGDPNLPPVESIDAEVEREVWSQPRPQELQIELDSNKTQQILSAMANFSLPNMAVPSWADGVPEERWKEELLERIRQRKPASNDSERETDNQTE